jgi:nucleotide-binding universal stress UspA family protein
MYSTMLVPVDGSAPSKVALDEAIKLAQALTASIRLLHVIEVRSLLTSEATAASYDTLFDMLRREGAQLLLDAAATISHAGISVDTVLMEAPDLQVGECIARKARECQADLIICGTHGRRGVRRLLMGSDADYIVRHAPVPVLLVRMPDAVSEKPTAAVGAAA